MPSPATSLRNPEKAAWFSGQTEPARQVDDKLTSKARRHGCVGIPSKKLRCEMRLESTLDQNGGGRGGKGLPVEEELPWRPSRRCSATGGNSLGGRVEAGDIDEDCRNDGCGIGAQRLVPEVNGQVDLRSLTLMFVQMQVGPFIGEDRHYRRHDSDFL